MTTYRPEQQVAIAAGFRFQWEPAQNAHVLLFPEGMIELNDSAALILELCQTPTAIGDVIKSLQQRFAEASDLADDVLEFIADAHQRGWITVD